MWQVQGISSEAARLEGDLQEAKVAASALTAAVEV